MGKEISGEERNSEAREVLSGKCFVLVVLDRKIEY